MPQGNLELLSVVENPPKMRVVRKSDKLCGTPPLTKSSLEQFGEVTEMQHRRLGESLQPVWRITRQTSAQFRGTSELVVVLCDELEYVFGEVV